MGMIHKSRFWFGADSNSVVHKLASLEELIQISCFYDSKVYYWFHSYFEGFVYAYWEKFNLWRIVDYSFRQNGLSIKNKDLSISETSMERSVVWESHVEGEEDI